MRHTTKYRQIAHHRARGGVYIVVLGTAMFVTVVGMSALLMARVNTRITNANVDVTKARYYAQSLIEVGMLKAMNDPNWRTTHTNDVWVADYTWDEAVVTFKFVDEKDGDLADNPGDSVRLYGKATVNDAVRIYSVELQQASSATESSETLLSSYILGNFWDHQFHHWEQGQFFQPSLPAGTISWSVTRVRIQLAKNANANDGQIKVQLRPVDGSDMPTSTILEEIVVNESDMPTSLSWVEYAFSSVSGLSLAAGLALTLEHVTGLRSAQVGVNAPGTGRRVFNGAWTVQPGELYHEIYGKYTMTPLTPVTGTWQREVLP